MSCGEKNYLKRSWSTEHTVHDKGLKHSWKYRKGSLGANKTKVTERDMKGQN